MSTNTANGWTQEQERRYAEIVTKAKGLYNKTQEASIEFVVYLRTVELSGEWRRPNFNHFSDFLKREFPTSFGIKSYDNAVKLIEVYGQDLACRVGLEAAHAMTVDAIILHKNRIAAVTNALEDYWERDGVMPEYDIILKLTKEVVPRENAVIPLITRNRQRQIELKNAALAAAKELKVARRDTQQAEERAAKAQRQAERATKRHETLAEENVRLKAELKEAKAEVRRLTRENARLTKLVEGFGKKRKPKGSRSS
jgi:hypothetical protein